MHTSSILFVCFFIELVFVKYYASLPELVAQTRFVFLSRSYMSNFYGMAVDPQNSKLLVHKRQSVPILLCTPFLSISMKDNLLGPTVIHTCSTGLCCCLTEFGRKSTLCILIFGMEARQSAIIASCFLWCIHASEWDYTHSQHASLKYSGTL